MDTRPRHPGYLRGSAQLATDAVLGLTDLVEAMHSRIATLPVLGSPARDERTRGVTGLVYRSVRGATRRVGERAQAALGWLDLRLGSDDTPNTERLPRPEREALRSALNGVVGDYLAASGNPLAISMRFRVAGRSLLLERDALHERLPDAGPRPLILLHGLCMNDLQWQRDGHDHGLALARDAGFTPVYLHYNSGLSIADNGRLLAQQMEPLLAAWPVPITGLTLLGHSMGGLVARSALQQALSGRLGALRWPMRVSDLVCLGTPHLGAPLEAAGHLVARLLGAAPYAAPLARLAQLRSAGIKDLRKGDRTPLPTGPRCYALAANLKAANANASTHLLGDGLVSVASALGQHRHAARHLGFVPTSQAVVHSTSHLGLLSSPVAYAQLLDWLKPASPGSVA
ncbi:MAG: hypothetical protein R3F04_07995 [Lysobacteraceae bacterium]